MQFTLSASLSLLSLGHWQALEDAAFRSLRGLLDIPQDKLSS
jgi:hypothetical protein